MTDTAEAPITHPGEMRAGFDLRIGKNINLKGSGLEQDGQHHRPQQARVKGAKLLEQKGAESIPSTPLGTLLKKRKPDKPFLVYCVGPPVGDPRPRCWHNARISLDSLPEWPWHDICAHLKCTKCGTVGWVAPAPATLLQPRYFEPGMPQRDYACGFLSSLLAHVDDRMRAKLA